MLIIGEIIKTIGKLIPYILIGLVVFFYMLYEKEKEHNAFVTSVSTGSDVHQGDRKDFMGAIDTMKNLPVKAKQIKDLTHITEKTTVTFITHLKDSIIRDSVHVKCIDYTNGHITIKGCDGDSMRVSYEDSLNVIVYRKPAHQFLFFKWGFKDTAQVFARDPNARFKLNIYMREQK